MVFRSAARTIVDLRLLLAKLEKERDAYDLVPFAQLRHILRRRIVALTAELRAHSSSDGQRHAA